MDHFQESNKTSKRPWTLAQSEEWTRQVAGHEKQTQTQHSVQPMSMSSHHPYHMSNVIDLVVIIIM